MTSRRSSGSMRAESAVEPTRSENITVTWRRSAVSCGLRLGSRSGGLRCAGLAPASSLIARRALSADAQASDADLFEVLIGQIREDRKIDAVLGKALRVLGHAELFEPVRNLPASRPLPPAPFYRAELLDRATESLTDKLPA